MGASAQQRHSELAQINQSTLSAPPAVRTFDATQMSRRPRGSGSLIRQRLITSACCLDLAATFDARASSPVGGASLNSFTASRLVWDALAPRCIDSLIQQCLINSTCCLNLVFSFDACATSRRYFDSTVLRHRVWAEAREWVLRWGESRSVMVEDGGG